MVVSLLGALEKSARLTGSLQPSAGFWYSSVAGKLNLSFTFPRLPGSFCGSSGVTEGLRFTKSLSVSYELSNIQEPGVHGSSNHVLPVATSHYVVLMGLSMSVGFNRWKPVFMLPPPPTHTGLYT